MEQPVKWILLTNFAQLHLIRVNEITPSFSFKLDDLWPRREELWELLALENLEADRIDELYDQHKKAGLDQQFLADLKRWRLLIANGFALRNQKRSLDEITLASQQLLDRFIFCRMLETQRLSNTTSSPAPTAITKSFTPAPTKPSAKSCANRFSSRSKMISTLNFSSNRCCVTSSP